MWALGAFNNIKCTCFPHAESPLFKACVLSTAKGDHFLCVRVGPLQQNSSFDDDLGILDLAFIYSS